MVMLCKKIDFKKAEDMMNNDSRNLIVEEKYDGERMLARFEKGRLVELINRRDNVKTDYYPELKNLTLLKPVSCVLDGEVIAKGSVFGEFNALLHRQVESDFARSVCVETNPVKFVAFDIVEYKHVPVTVSPLVDRRNLLDSLMDAQKYGFVSPKIGVQELLSFWGINSHRKEFEGVVIKDLDSSYVDKRTKDWLKLKNRVEIACKIDRFERTPGKLHGGFVVYVRTGNVEQRVVVNSILAQEQIEKGCRDAEFEYQRVELSGKWYQPSFKRVLFPNKILVEVKLDAV